VLHASGDVIRQAIGRKWHGAENAAAYWQHTVSLWCDCEWKPAAGMSTGSHYWEGFLQSGTAFHWAQLLLGDLVI